MNEGALVLAAAALGVAAMLCLTFLRAWRGWLELRRLELGRNAAPDGVDDVGVRIELADVRERLKKIEAIADGLEL